MVDEGEWRDSPNKSEMKTHCRDPVFRNFFFKENSSYWNICIIHHQPDPLNPRKK